MCQDKTISWVMSSNAGNDSEMRKNIKNMMRHKDQDKHPLLSKVTQIAHRN